MLKVSSVNAHGMHEVMNAIEGTEKEVVARSGAATTVYLVERPDQLQMQKEVVMASSCTFLPIYCLPSILSSHCTSPSLPVYLFPRVFSSECTPFPFTVLPVYCLTSALSYQCTVFLLLKRSRLPLFRIKFLQASASLELWSSRGIWSISRWCCLDRVMSHILIQYCVIIGMISS